MAIPILQFLAIMVSALALIPAGAHLAALPNKIGLPQQDYFVVQHIYRGWAAFGWLWPGAVLADALLAWLVRSQVWSFWFAVFAALGFLLMLAIFRIWTFPANRQTGDWTQPPDNWERLRRQWEYSHGANAAIGVLSLALLVLSVLSWRPS